MIDSAPLAKLVAEFMDEIEDEFGDVELEFVDALIVVEMRGLNDENNEISTVAHTSISKRNVSALGLAIRASDALRLIDRDDT